MVRFEPRHNAVWVIFPIGVSPVDVAAAPLFKTQKMSSVTGIRFESLIHSLHELQNGKHIKPFPSIVLYKLRLVFFFAQLDPTGTNNHD